MATGYLVSLVFGFEWDEAARAVIYGTKNPSATSEIIERI